MSTDEQDKIIGRLVRQKKELEQEAGLVEAEIKNMGGVLQTLGQALGADSLRATVQADKATRTLCYIDSLSHRVQDYIDYPDKDRLVDLLARLPELQQAIQEKKDCLAKCLGTPTE